MALDRDPLVTTAWLADRLDDPDIRIVNADWFFPHENRDAQAEFESSHIPGAIFFDIDGVADYTTVLPHMLPFPKDFADAAGTLGLGNKAMIVVYESGAPRSAARVWWTFRAMGHEAVFVLDGGLRKWRAEGRRTDIGLARPTPATFTPRFDPNLIRNAADVREILESGAAQVVDARPAARFRGEAPEPREGLKAGHMPGAVNLPASELYTPDGEMLPIEALSRRITDAGIDPQKPLISSCGSGITACMIALAMARLGHWDTAVYDGSWAQWGALRNAPVVIGP